MNTEMTDIIGTDAEFSWSSSEEGNAAAQAVLARATRLGIEMDAAEAGGLAWAALRAVEAARNA